ncbi:MAG: acetate/propionate family kinase [Acidobacteria bacterium]|nr:acetate/propionate family kinase [Acidobacteriota bacterium]
MNILVPNLGSTSLKYQLISMPGEAVLRRGRMERVADYTAAIRDLPLDGAVVDAVAFKAVHGGPRFRGTFVIDADVLAGLQQFLPAAPAHNAIYLTGIRAFQQAMPDTPLVAAFETEFHASMPACASAYGVPQSWRGEGVARYGFHGASHQYVSERVPQILGRSAEGLRLVSCHLGGSASICAIRSGRAVDTTMGFSPQSGLENATRHGDLDVFAVFYMMERHGWTLEHVREQLTRTGGLAGLSGVAGGDVRDIIAAGTADARLALDVFAYQVRKTIGAYAAALGGLDAVAFTGGIGENSAALREACCDGLEFLGIRLDPGRAEGAVDRIVSYSGTSPAVVVLGTNEELVVARRAYRLLSNQTLT